MVSCPVETVQSEPFNPTRLMGQPAGKRKWVARAWPEEVTRGAPALREWRFKEAAEVGLIK